MPDSSLRADSNTRKPGRSSWLRFLVGFVVMIAAFYAVWVTDTFRRFVFVPSLHGNATVGSFFLNLLGDEPTQKLLGTIIVVFLCLGDEFIDLRSDCFFPVE